MEYKVIEVTDDAQTLQEAVNEHIQKGWEPQGGVAIYYSTNSNTWRYYQAIVRKSRK
jgi:hypothetical protein